MILIRNIELLFCRKVLKYSEEDHFFFEKKHNCWQIFEKLTQVTIFNALFFFSHHSSWRKKVIFISSGLDLCDHINAGSRLTTSPGKLTTKINRIRHVVEKILLRAAKQVISGCGVLRKPVTCAPAGGPNIAISQLFLKFESTRSKQTLSGGLSPKHFALRSFRPAVVFSQKQCKLSHFSLKMSLLNRDLSLSRKK